MELDLLKEQIYTSKRLYNGRSEHIESLEVIVPDYLPDAKSIVSKNARIILKDKTAQDDKVILSGEVAFEALFSAEGGSAPIPLRARAPFRETISVAGATQRTLLAADLRLGMSDAVIVNSRKVGFKAVVEIDLRAYEPVTLELPSQLTESDARLETLNKSVELTLVSGIASKQFSIEEDMELPQGKPSVGELLSSRVSFDITDSKLITNKVIIKGAATVLSLYSPVGEDAQIETVENEIPFSLIVDVEGVDDSHDADVLLEPGDIIISASEDEEGTRVITASLSANAVVTTYGDITRDFITDAFSTDYDASLNMETQKLLSLYENRSLSINIKDALPLPQEREIKRIADVSTTLSAFDTVYENGGVKLTGSISLCALCIDAEGESLSISKTLPVELSFVSDASRRITADSYPPSLDTSFNLNISGELEVRVTGDMFVRVFEEVALPVLHSVELTKKKADSSEKPALYAYFIEKNETVWDVAKRYGASPADIIAANALTCQITDTPEGVKVLLIPMIGGR